MALSTKCIDKSVEEFANFVNSKIIKPDEDTKKYSKVKTHTIIFNKNKSFEGSNLFKGGTFHISGSDHDKFMKLYKAVQGKLKIPLVERFNETGKMVAPVVIDIDYKNTSSKRLYKLEHIESIIDICNSCFAKYLNIEEEKIKAFVTEKKNPSFDEKNKKYKDGFHIHYDIPLSKKKRQFFYEKIKEKVEEQDIFNGITKDSYSSIVDDSVFKGNGMVMFGSKKVDGDQYELKYIYDYELNQESIDDYKLDDIIDMFSLQQYTDEDNIEFVEKYEDLENDIEEGTYFENENNGKNTKKNTKTSKKLEFKSNYYVPGSYPLDKIPNEYKDTLDLVEILSDDRAGHYSSWIRVGWALYNTSHNLYNVFVNFSRKKNFDERGCYEKWMSFNADPSGVTISSLRYWAEEDNPEKYQEFLLKKKEDAVQKLEKINHNDIADIVVSYYGYMYKCASMEKNIWYEFRDHRWIRISKAYTLHNKIVNNIPEEFTSLKRYLCKKCYLESGIKQDDLNEQCKKMSMIDEKLKDENFIANILKALSRKLYDESFSDLLDSNPHLIGFLNGVYDLDLQKFREGRPDDRISLCTGYKYMEYSLDSKVIKSIDSFINKIQPQSHMKEYLLRLYSSCLNGRNRDQQFRIFTGSGSNGKSKMIDLFHATMGRYMDTIPSDVLTLRNNNPNAATPFLADKRGVRIVVAQEPEGNATIQAGKMKELTGGDPVSVRPLYENAFTFIPQFKLFLICNKLPKIPTDDGGTWRRIRVAPFKSKFVRSKKDVNEEKHHYLADTNIDGEKFKDWAPAFMWMLLNIYYPRYVKSGLSEPEEVRVYSDKYRQASDAYYEFLSDFYEITNNDKDKTKIMKMFEEFKNWHKNNYNYATKSSKRELEEYLEEKHKLRIDKIKGETYIFGVKELDFSDDDDDKKKKSSKDDSNDDE